MEKYLYFRTQATIGDDDDSAQSACWPLSSFLGMHPTADDTLALFFKSQMAQGSDAQDGNFINSDKVVLTLGTANTHKEAMEGLVKAFEDAKAFKGNPFIVVADDLSTVTSYLVSEVSAVSTIAVQTVMA
tara:strand:+ start:1240 stop:1629 length:390 start_codon:yes stop_codon:yes gene_type:complete